MITNAVDMHCDSISVLLERERNKDERKSVLRENDMHLDLMRMKESGYLLQNFALFVDDHACDDPWDEACALYQRYQDEMNANKDLIRPIYKFSDIEQNKADGLLSAMLTVEEGSVIKGSMDKLERLYDMGVRMMTLTWNYANEIGHPNTDLRRYNYEYRPGMGYTPDTERGLTSFGKEIVGRMQELGMIVDVSHLSDAGFYDVVDCVFKPFVASHSNARAMCGHVRNLTDDMIRKLAEKGGVTGLNFCADFMETVPEGMNNPGSIEAVIRHARHLVNMGGLESVGLGTDFDGIHTNEALPGVEVMPYLWESFHRNGFTERELDYIFYKNVLRVYKDCL